MRTLSEGKDANVTNAMTYTITEIHLFAKNKSDAPPMRFVVQKYVTSRSNVREVS